MIFFFPYNPHPPPIPTIPPGRPQPRELDFGPFRVRFGPFGSVWVRFRVRFGSVGWGRGGGLLYHLREKNITTLGFLFKTPCLQLVFKGFCSKLTLKAAEPHFKEEFGILRGPRSGVTSKWGFGVAMLPVGALCFCQAHFGRTVLPKWPLWAHLFYAVFYSISELRRACFRQARVARAVLPPGTLFRARAFALPFCAPKSQLCPLPHLGLVEDRTWTLSDPN